MPNTPPEAILNPRGAGPERLSGNAEQKDRVNDVKSIRLEAVGWLRLIASENILRSG